MNPKIILIQVLVILTLVLKFLAGTVALADIDVDETVPSPLGQTICAEAQTTSGIDVSAWQPGGQWATALQAGAHFVFIKSTQGVGYVNPDFAGQWAASKAAGVIRGAYHYFVPSDDPVAQANYYVATVGSLEESDLPPVLDWEITGGVPNAQNLQNGLAFLQRVEAATGRVPMIYVSPGFWVALGQASAEFAHYPLYVADHDTRCPHVPAPWTSWSFWQSAIGTTAGIQGPTDQDIFNGVLSELTSLLGSI